MKHVLFIDDALSEVYLWGVNFWLSVYKSLAIDFLFRDLVK